MLLVERLIATENEIQLVRTNQIGNSLESVKKELSIKLMGYAVVKSSLHLFFGRIVDIK